MFYINNEIKTLHLEISTKCNASCPMCSRNNEGYGVNPAIQPQNLSLACIQNFIPPDFIEGLSRVIVCGNFGDPLMNPEVVQIFEYFKLTNPNLRIELHTNGGVGNANTWIQLAKTVHFCRFGIDGLKDTNHIYRRGVNWQNLLKNVKIFVEAGGKAEWAFLVFKHNEHQLAEAEKLSHELGFKKFIPKRSTRHIKSNGEVSAQWPVKKNESEIEYFIEAATDEKFQKNLQIFLQNKANFENYDKYLGLTPINCKVAKENSIYIAADGLVFPCCWLGIDYALKDDSNATTKSLIHSIGAQQSELNMKNIDLNKILSGKIFNAIKDTWAGPNRIKKCAQVCGEGFDPFTRQFG